MAPITISVKAFNDAKFDVVVDGRRARACEGAGAQEGEGERERESEGEGEGEGEEEGGVWRGRGAYMRTKGLQSIGVRSLSAYPTVSRHDRPSDPAALFTSHPASSA